LDLADFPHHLDYVRIVHYVGCVESHLPAVSRLFSELGPNGRRAEVETGNLNAYGFEILFSQN